MTPDALRERVAEQVKAVWQDYAMPVGPTMFRAMADAALDATPLAEMREENERLREALASVRDWADAYPVERFQEPDLAEVHAVLADNNMGNQVDRMHASWARHLTEGIGDIARAALGGGG